MSEPEEEDFKACSECGYEIFEGETECTECGASLIKDEEE